MTDLEEMFRDISGCCLHDPQWKPEDVDTELAWVGDRHTGSDSSSLIIVKLKDRSFGLLTQSEDYTGHGCQCTSATCKEKTLRELLTHLDEYELAWVIKRD